MTTVEDAPTRTWAPPKPVGTSPEMDALQPFLFDCEWTGTVRPNGMGPGSPEMNAIGKATFRPAMDGGWLFGDLEQDQFVDGQRVITWKAHFVIGWDPRVGEYRATYVDNNASSAVLRGRIEGSRFIIETVGDGAVRNRMEWELVGGGLTKWRNDCSIDGGPWFLVEDYVCTPIAESSKMK
jgi:Protein of unknown function (DUF1579)